MANYCTSHSAKNETHRHETAERHILHRHSLTAMTKQCNHKQKRGTFSSVAAAAVQCVRAEGLLLPCRCRSLVFPVQKEVALGKARPRTWQLSRACRVRFISRQSQRFPSLALDSGGRYVVCSHRDVRRSGLDTNYCSEIWDG